MLAYWCLSQNFGDRLTSWLVQKITGSIPQWVAQDDPRPHLLGVGSILNQAGERSIVWGAGLGSMSDEIREGTDIRLTRGPLSAWRARLCGCEVPEVYGDPALLCPRFREAKPKAHKLGIVYHYVDQSHWPLIEGAAHVNVLAEPDQVIDGITECEAIISSSLHGLIVADAYGIPAAWLHSPRLFGDGMKFADHILAVGGAWPQPLHWNQIEGKSIEELIGLIPKRTVKFDADAILSAFPNKLHERTREISDPRAPVPVLGKPDAMASRSAAEISRHL